MTNKQLWCVNIQGPDDIIAMSGRASAQVYADELNKFFTDYATKHGHKDDPSAHAIVAPWPWSAESHADDLARDPAEYPPRTFVYAKP